MKKVLGLIALTGALFIVPSMAQVVTLPVVNTASGLKTSSGASVIIGSDGTEKGTASNPVVTSCPTCSGGSGPSSSQLPATLGAKTGALSLSVVPNTDTAFPVSQSGAWNITNISGTVSLPTGASTSALQTTINTTLGTPFQAGGSIGNTSFAATQATASNLNAQVVGSVAAGSTATPNPLLAGARYNTTLPTYTVGQIGEVQIDSRGSLRSLIVGVLAAPANSSNAIYATNTGTTSTGPLYVANGIWDGTVVRPQRGDDSGTLTQLAVTGSRWQYAAAAGGISNTTTAVTVCPAQGGTLRCYMTSMQLDATALGAATEIVVRDGASGTVIWRGAISTAGVGNDNIVFPVPLKGTANTLMEVATITATITGAVYVNSQGFAGN